MSVSRLCRISLVCFLSIYLQTTKVVLRKVLELGTDSNNQTYAILLGDDCDSTN